MKTAYKYLLAGITCVVLSGSAFAQISVSHTLNQGGLEAFFLSDFDITQPSNSVEVFRLFVSNSDPEETFRIALDMKVNSREFGQLSQGRTAFFDLPPSPQPLSIASFQLFSNAGPFHFTDYNIADEVLKGLLDDILSTGRLPSDIYTFRIEVIFQEGAPTGDVTDDFEIRVTNPRKLDLIFPGGPATGRLQDVQKIFTPLPFFRLESDLRRFRVIVAEGRPGEDPESALNQEPRFIKNFVVDPRGTGGVFEDFGDLGGRVDVLPSPAFQYPASGTVLSLRPGRVYYWRAIGFIRSSSGPVPLESEIYSFRIAALDQVAGGDDQIQIVLRALLGNDYEQLFGDDGQLEGFLPKRVMFDGKEITATELLTRLRKLRNSYKGYSIEN